MGFLNLVIINYESYFESENNNKNANIYISFNNVWSFINYNEKNNENSENYYLPIQGKPGLYYTLFLLLSISIFAGCFLYLHKTNCSKDDSVYKMMTDSYQKYHFIPIFCASALYIVGTINNVSYLDIVYHELNDKNNNQYLTCFSLNLFFSIAGLLSMIFIKIKSRITKPVSIVYSVEYGVYSYLIPLFTYCFFYSIIYITIFNNLKSIQSIYNIKKNCGIAFSILMGIINLIMSVLLRDIIIPVITFIIYIGLADYILEYQDKENKERIPKAEKVFDFIYIFLSFLIILFNLYIHLRRKKQTNKI